MKKVVVLGAGLVGKAIALDLQKNYAVVSVDINADRLASLESFPAVETLQADLSDPQAIKKAIADCDLVIGAVPGFMGYQMLQTVLEQGKDIVDISFFNEDPFELDELAKEKDVTAIVDCGVAPGMDNIILGYHTRHMQVASFECLVGGLPRVREWSYEFKAPFSPIDVIAEYTRPARYIKDGKLITKPALTDPELIRFDRIGTLEAFNTDGLRSLLKTMKVPNMIERTLRYPGHIELMRVLRETGFFSEEKVRVGDAGIRPLDLTAKLLFPLWQLKDDDEEFTVMRVTVEGTENGEARKYVYHLLDSYDPATKTSSMARTTGYTCTAAASLLLNGKFSRKGIIPPEYLGEEPGCLDLILEYLAGRGVIYECEVSKGSAT